MPCWLRTQRVWQLRVVRRFVRDVCTACRQRELHGLHLWLEPSLFARQQLRDSLSSWTIWLHCKWPMRDV
jgi:hypothetical protein